MIFGTNALVGLCFYLLGTGGMTAKTVRASNGDRVGVTVCVVFMDCCSLVTSEGGIVQSLETLRGQVTEQVSQGISSSPSLLTITQLVPF